MGQCHLRRTAARNVVSLQFAWRSSAGAPEDRAAQGRIVRGLVRAPGGRDRGQIESVGPRPTTQTRDRHLRDDGLSLSGPGSHADGSLSGENVLRL